MKTCLRALAVAAVMLMAGLIATAQVKDFKPVTEAMLLNPDPADWLNFRRTLDGWGYSPLNQINKQNVQQLQLVWSWGLNPGTSEPTPLVSNGTMYVPNPGGGVQALDAATGDLLWDFKAPTIPRRAPGANAQAGAEAQSVNTLRNIAIYGDKIYTAAGTHLIALNAGTGAVVWDHQVHDPALGYRFTAGPIAVRGKIIAGTTGCERYKKESCYITALDAQTGKEAWRTSTIARPGEPGGDTWGDLPLMFRAGGDNWQAGSYDPKTNLIYYGTAQAKPWARFQRGTDGDALYTNSTLALDPDTGKMVWYYQHLPGDTHDMDETFERVLIDHDGKSSVFSMGKLAILWELDRRNGAFLSAHDLGYQTILSNIDPRTGKVTFRPDAIPRPGVEVNFCPSTAGFKSWKAMAYHPDTQAFYIPLNLTCEKGEFGSVEHVEGGGGTGAVRRTNQFHPESPDGLGEFVAMDIKTGKVIWRHRTRTPMNTAALTTGGGLVVVGDWDRYLYIHDVATGKILFETRLPTSLSGFPMTYAIRGRQYLAIPVGSGGGTWSTSVPADLVPEKKIAPSANAIYVFALPDARGAAQPAR
jgi:PQQ-dependent dehydrogenase (methanol/ethanol family)